MAGHRRSILALCLLISCFFPIFSATGSETVTYSYDARGRLVQVSRSGTVNNGVQASYSYDKADNRTNVTVTGAAGTTLTLSPTSLPNGTVGTAYSQTISASGGSGGYTYSKTSGALPAGLALNGSTGVLSGTPTTASTYSFTITATDSASNTGNRAYSVTTSSGGTTLTLSPTSLPNGTVGTAYSQTISASGGSGGYTYSKTAGTLPAGLALNGSTGVLSGTPTTAASYSFTVTATDSASNTGSRAYSVTISSAATCNGISFSVSNAADDEGIPLGFVVTKAGSTTSSCSVSYATANNTAVAPGDYTAITTTILNFQANETTKTVYVTTFTTGPNEGTETMYLNLSNPTGGATISDSQGLGTIYNYFDDGGGGGCDPVCP
jgi:hypothetical protein